MLLRIESFSAMQRSHLPEPHLKSAPVYPISLKNGPLIFEVPNILGESCAVLVRCLVEALCVVRETLLERRFRATNVLFYCIITGLDCGFVDDSFLLTLSIEGTVALVSTVAHL